MRKILKQLALSAAVTLSAISVSAPTYASTVRIALGDVASVETLAMLVALERAKEKGLDYELTTFAKENLAIQAMISGQMDIGIGSPYSVIQKTKTKLRNFFQLSKLVFYPVVSKEYKTWQDLDNEPFTFHARGTGTEAIGSIIAKREGITIGTRSYVPGSENRIVGMMRGQLKATIVDISNKNILLKKAGDRFHVLPGLDGNASDEIMFANEGWINSNPEDVAILVEALLRTWREMNADPTIIDKERKRFGLLADLPSELLEEVDAYYQEAIEAELYDPNGGGALAVQADFDFYVEAGQLKGPADSLKVADYWDLRPLNRAKEKLSN
ncbi:MAG: ABC transporter substrate-binding protein [Pseudomonadales bacterium]|nr:ABC transporter substrate-binding protein [Pseudomonadales bacterium]NRA18348.1 ABC transporter substrate-binding protein [Oceanospirillaceae bacterium]